MICDSVAIMNKGEIVRQGAITELTEKSRRYVIRTQGDVPAELLSKLKSDGADIEAETITIYQSDPAPIQPILDALRGAGVTIVEMRELRQSLEEMFMEVVANETIGGTQKNAGPPALPGKGVK